MENAKRNNPQPEKDGLPQDPAQNAVLYLRDMMHLVIVILLVFLLLFRLVVVSGSSMYDTLIDGDYVLLLSNLLYREPEPGDIIVISKDSYDDGAAIVKRVIATEGQSVDIDFENGIVYVDGQALEEDYIYTQTTVREGVHFPLIVADGCVFVLGDNRAVSKDSRSPEIGQIDEREILGKVICLLLPGTNHGMEPRDFERMGAIE